MGPTAVGKTSVAIALAQQFSTKIISADSRQCYKELNIGVAKPSPDELTSIHHYFINSHSVHETVNAGVFEKYAIERIGEIFLEQDIAVMCGGTGMYIKAFCDGIDEIPPIPDDVKTEIKKGYENGGLKWLQDEVNKQDPEFFSAGEIQNPQRLMRALEVRNATGNSILYFQKNRKIKRDFRIIKIGLDLPKDELHSRINARTDQMITKGLLQEVEGLNPFRHLNALQTVGYKEFFDYIDKYISLEDAISAIKTNTRQYAKRQLTWFKKDNEIGWCNPDIKEVMEILNQKLPAS